MRFIMAASAFVSEHHPAGSADNHRTRGNVRICGNQRSFSCDATIAQFAAGQKEGTVSDFTQIADLCSDHDALMPEYGFGAHFYRRFFCSDDYGILQYCRLRPDSHAPGFGSHDTALRNMRMLSQAHRSVQTGR